MVAMIGYVRPETFIVRVYRRSPRRGFEVVGRVETPGGTRHARFASLAELAAILSSPRAHMRRTGETEDVDRS
jgi:hypothetical protein